MEIAELVGGALTVTVGVVPQAELTVDRV